MSIHLSISRRKPCGLYVRWRLRKLKCTKKEKRENGKLCNFQPFTINFLLFAPAVIIVDRALCVRTPHFLYSDFSRELKEIKYQRKIKNFNFFLYFFRVLSLTIVTTKFSFSPLNSHFSFHAMAIFCYLWRGRGCYKGKKFLSICAFLIRNTTIRHLSCCGQSR